jgi:hypothetical protein
MNKTHSNANAADPKKRHCALLFGAADLRRSVDYKEDEKK